MPETLVARHAITVEDVVYQPGLLARLYRPAGPGPFPAALQVHGGAWTSKDRTDNAFMTGKPHAPYAARALDRMQAFVRKHTTL